MSDLKTLKLTLKKKPVAPETNRTEVVKASKRIGKKMVYQVNQYKKPEASVPASKPQWSAPVVKSQQPSAAPKPKPKAPAPAPKKEKKERQPTRTVEEIKAYRKEKAAKAIAWLKEHYPKLFTPESKKPLAIGIHKKIQLLNPSIPRSFIKAGLNAWVQTDDYCQAIIDGAGRYDVEGHRSGEIMPKEKEYAEKYLANLKRRQGNQKDKNSILN